MSDIPTGVYYSRDTDNFYQIETHAGMGQSFWSQWRHRKFEFPSETSIRGRGAVRPNHKQLSTEIYLSNVEAGWWTNIETGEPLERNFGEMIALVHSELSECWEGRCLQRNDDHLPEFLNWHVEVADACIRVYDILKKIFPAIAFIPFNLDMPESFIDFEDRLVFLHALISNALEGYRKSDWNRCVMYLWRFLDACFEWAEEENFDLLTTIKVKWEFNRNRADHKIENRIKDGGKKI